MVREVLQALQKTLVEYGVFEDLDSDVYFVDEENMPCSPGQADHLLVELELMDGGTKRFEIFLYPTEE